MKIRHLVLVGLGFALAAPISQPVFAQSELEEIIVTARKREESILEIPVSVTALSQVDMNRAGIDDAEDLSSFVAGLEFEGSTSTGGRQNPSIRIRGINQQIITPATQVGALFWDGSFIGSGGGYIPLADVERVEVIKGPQTAYFGRNTFTGAVNIIPKLPGEEWETNIGLEFSPSQEAEYKAEIGVGGPLSDTIGLRVYAGFDKDGGDFDTQDGEPYAVFEDTTITGVLTFEPTDNLSFKLSGYYVEADDNGTSVGVDARTVGVPGGSCNIVYTGTYINAVSRVETPFTRDLSQYTGTPGLSSGALFCGSAPDGSNLVTPVTVTPTLAQSAFGQSGIDALNGYYMDPAVLPAEIADVDIGLLRSPPGELGGRHVSRRLQLSGDYDFSNHTLSFLLSQAGTGNVDRRDFSFGVPFALPATTVGITGVDIVNEERYGEVRIASSGDERFRYMLGFSHYEANYRAVAGTNVDFQDNYTTALFGSIDYDFTDALTLSVEARKTDEESQVEYEGSRFAGCANVNCGLVNDYDDFIPRVILSYTPFDGATLYGSYSYSSILGLATQCRSVAASRPDLIDINDCDAIGDFTAPQENTAYEIGWKQQLDRLTFTAAIYNMVWDNQPFAAVILLNPGTTSFRGPGDSEYTGFDFEFNWAPTDWMDLRGFVSYVDGELTSFSSRGTNESVVLGSGANSVKNDGNEPRNIPAWSWALTPTFYGELAGRPVFLRTDFLFRGEAWADYSEYNRIDSQLLVNLRAGMEINETFGIEIYGKNLTNDKTLGYNGGTTSSQFGVPEPDRKWFTEPYQKPEFGIRFTADF